MTRFAIFRTVISCAAFAVMPAPPTCLSDEPPQLTRLEPNSLAIGQTSEVRAIGQFKTWPVQIWSSSPDVTWTCLPDSGVFQVSVANSAKQTEAWFRLFNAAGTTTPRRILLSTQPSLLEKEPNDQPSMATDILADQVVSGTLEKNLDVDLFRVSLNQGDSFWAALDSHRFGSPADANLQLLNEKGFVVAESIDHFGLDPALSVSIKQSGIYYVKVFAFPAEPDSTISFRGGPDWWYRLRCNKGALPYEIPTPRAAILSECSQVNAAAGLTTDTATPLNLQNKAFQAIRTSSKDSPKQEPESHFYKLPKAPGTPIRIEVTAKSMGSDLDPTLSIIDESGKQQSFQDDSGNDRDPSISWTIPDDKNYFAVISDFHRQGGERHDYWISLSQVHPNVRATASADSYSSKVNQDVEINLKWDNPGNWTGDLELLPSNTELELSIEPNLIKIEKETKEFSVKLKASKPFAGELPLQIKRKDKDSLIPVSATPFELLSPWLTVRE